jgi:hypothetical protein
VAYYTWRHSDIDLRVFLLRDFCSHYASRHIPCSHGHLNLEEYCYFQVTVHIKRFDLSRIYFLASHRSRHYVTSLLMLRTKQQNNTINQPRKKNLFFLRAAQSIFNWLAALCGVSGEFFLEFIARSSVAQQIAYLASVSFAVRNFRSLRVKHFLYTHTLPTAQHSVNQCVLSILFARSFCEPNWYKTRITGRSCRLFIRSLSSKIKPCKWLY